MIYLDNSATTAMSKEVIDAFTFAAVNHFGNPSSRHSLGAESHRLLENCRERAAKVMGVSSDEIYFTSGGTESDNIAVLGGANIKKGKRIVTTAVEHPAVLRCMERLEEQGFEVIYLKPEKNGSVNIEAFREAINKETCLVSVMSVNNETGAIMPVDRLKAIMNKTCPRALLHTDAVQAFGHIPINFQKWGLDAVSISGHKIHGPKGIGVLYVRKGAVLKTPVLGGGQEKGLRSGTENTAAIMGLTVALEQTKTENKDLAPLKKILSEGLSEIPEAYQNGGENCADHILNVSFKGIRSEVMLNALNAMDICVSAGSACASSKGGGSHVLKAMEGLADNAVRFSLSRFNTEEEMIKTTAAVKKVIEMYRR